MKKFINLFKIKDLKTFLKILTIVSTINLISIVFFFIYKNGILTYYNFLFVLTFFVFGFGYMYSSRKINKIRRKTKNWDKPLSEEEKATYKPLRFICYYSCFINSVIYLIVWVIDKLI